MDRGFGFEVVSPPEVWTGRSLSDTLGLVLWTEETWVKRVVISYEVESPLTSCGLMASWTFLGLPPDPAPEPLRANDGKRVSVGRARVNVPQNSRTEDVGECPWYHHCRVVRRSI